MDDPALRRMGVHNRVNARAVAVNPQMKTALPRGIANRPRAALAMIVEGAGQNVQERDRSLANASTMSGKVLADPGVIETSGAQCLLLADIVVKVGEGSLLPQMAFR
jgi:hypothetical protein